MFGFLYNSNDLKSLQENDLLKCCNDLHIALESDVDGTDLFCEIKMCRQILTDQLGSMLEILQYIYNNNISELYPNFITSLKIALTMPVTVASAERSFSKLSIIKNYLRSTISQERFSCLSILSIEIDMAKNISYDDIIAEFAIKHARKRV